MTAEGFHSIGVESSIHLPAQRRAEAGSKGGEPHPGAVHLRMAHNIVSKKRAEWAHRTGQGDKWSPQFLISREPSPLSITLRESGQVPWG